MCFLVEDSEERWFKLQKQMKELDIKTINKVINYFIQNRYRVYLAILIVAIAFLGINIPYLNLYINQDLLWPVVVALMLVALNISQRTGVFVIIFLFVVSPFYIILRREEMAEFLGNVIFFVILIVWARAFVGYLSENKD